MRKKGLWFIIILALGFFLRFYGLGQKSLWDDEFSSLECAENPFPEIIRASKLSPPLYYFILHFVVERWGNGEGTLRFTAALAGALTIYIIYLLGKIWVNAEVGLISAFILSISSFHILISQEARMYSLIILLSGLMLISFIKAISTQKARYWFAYCLVTLAALYTSHISVFLIIGQFLSLISIERGTRRASFISFFKSLMLIGPLYIPGLIIIINQYFWGRTVSFSPRLSMDMAVRLAGVPFHFLAGYLLANPSWIEVKFILRDFFGAIFVILTISLCLIIFVLFRHSDREGWVKVRFLWWMFIFPILGLYLIMPGRVAARQLGVCALPFFINLAIAIRRGYVREPLARVMVIILLIINFTALIDYYRRSDNPFAKTNWRLASFFISDNFHPQEDIIVSNRDYYLSDTAKKSRIKEFDRIKITRILEGRGKVWLILNLNHDKEIIAQLERLSRENKVSLEKRPFGENLGVYILNQS